MDSPAVILEAPERIALRPLELSPIGPGDVMVDIVWSGVSTGTERLLWSGRMPHFPGLSYPLVPGYESVGRITLAGADARDRIGEWVFVPGANCFQGARGLFGATARRLVVPAARALPVPESLGAEGVLLALAATAVHAFAGGTAPDLIVGHGVLGRLIARIAIAQGAPPPVVWEINPLRRQGAQGYLVVDPSEDARRDYRSIYDVSGHAAGLDDLIARLARGGEIVLAGFYEEPLAFTFVPAFMREARLRVAAEWQPADLQAALALVEYGALNLSGLVTDVREIDGYAEAYPHAFADPACLKMVLDWRGWP